MFRARIGNQNSSGNKVLRAKLEKKKDDERQRRIEKIKNRKPGTSRVTLDNTPPVVIEAMKTNPRKKALQINFNIVTEKENMCMLKRISAILTAPPKITDAEYKAMRKLCPTLRGLKEVYEHNIVLQHNKQFFTRLKSINAYYNAHEWERDYQLQKKGQKFMRQVTYSRPKDFADPYGLDSPVNLDKIKSISGSMETREPAANHVSRVRSIKANNDAARKSEDRSNRNSGTKKSHSSSLPSLTHSNDPDSKSKSAPLFNTNGSRESAATNGDGGYETNDFDEFNETEKAPGGTDQHDVAENKIELCSIRRSMRVVDFLTTADLAEFPPEDLMDHISPRGMHGTEPPVLIVDMDVKCFLVNNVDLVISAITCQGQPIFVDAEAEAPVSELCALQGVPYKNTMESSQHSIEQEMLFIESLEGLAREIATTVEIKVEDEIPRLVLNVFDKKTPFASEDDDDYYDTEFDPYDSKSGPINLTDEDVEGLLLDPITIEKEMEVKVKFIVQSQIPAPTNGTRSSVAYGTTPNLISVTKNVFENLNAVVSISSAKDDKVDVKLVFKQASDTKYSKKSEKKGNPKAATVVPAVDVGLELNTSTGLPSIMHADTEMISEFLTNLTSSIMVEHNGATGECKVVLIDEAT